MKLKDAVRQKTRRTSGDSLAVIIADVNRTLRGWFAYFKHSHRTTFRPIDEWVRARLRHILHRRHGGRRRAGAATHRRWPRCFFVAQGLFSVERAHAAARQSSVR
jgi:RNA-directed DNA polymerase